MATFVLDFDIVKSDPAKKMPEHVRCSKTAMQDRVSALMNELAIEGQVGVYELETMPLSRLSAHATSDFMGYCIKYAGESAYFEVAVPETV